MWRPGFIIAITSAFLLVRSAVGLAAGFLARAAFFGGLAFLPRLRFGFAAAGSGVAFTESIAFSLIEFLLDRVAVVTSHHSGSEKHQAKSSKIRPGEADAG